MHDPSYLLAEALGASLNALNLRLALAESCTGGGIAKAITDVPGSSAWFDRGFVTYSNDAKIDMLGVKPETLARVGAVSEEAALEMVAGALTHSLADWALAVTGIAGPDGGTPAKPVGTVFIAWQMRGASGVCWKKQFSGDRHSIRQQATLFCLLQLLQMRENP
ncbi:MAG: damage-inducible protein CinA [Proteobacteria bacterium ST_bin11]|jgi:nicotinamide-nucleotide amidase|nr:MAG: damage-inducible protein CinA [Proteobacteria bacterium ST_bin11]